MKSPFPGMDPYLEAHCGDIHTRLIVYASNQLNARLPDELQALVEEDVTVLADERTRTIYPDVQVIERPMEPSAEGGVATITLAEPYVVTVADEPQTQRRVEIVDTTQGGRLITVIEFLSPANKAGAAGPEIYARKQQELIRARVNLVEIDLIRTGEFVLAIPQAWLPAPCRTPYLICIVQATERGRFELYPVSLREPLPNIPIPLRPTDKDVALQLQPLLDACYRDGRYHRLDYRADPMPKLEPPDAQWADALLREKKLR